MATTITNVYVKNRAAGETSFKEVDSVYKGSTKVFRKESFSSVTNPQGIIPLKTVTPTTPGPYGNYRSLYTQDEMDTTISTAYGFLLMPIVDSTTKTYYEPDWDTDGTLYVEYEYIYNGNPITTSFKVPLAENGNWIVTKKQLAKRGNALFSPTLTYTLYMSMYPGFDFDKPQYCYLLNKVGSPLTISARVYMIPYKPVYGPATGDKWVYVGQDIVGNGLKSTKNEWTGVQYIGTHNLFVN